MNASYVLRQYLDAQNVLQTVRHAKVARTPIENLMMISPNVSAWNSCMKTNKGIASFVIITKIASNVLQTTIMNVKNAILKSFGSKRPINKVCAFVKTNTLNTTIHVFYVR